jgi:N-acetylmuramoyl-L-alanine amidase
VAPLRKQDPGELFDWYRLFVEGIANWPTPKAVEWSDDQFFQALAAYGYDLTGPAQAKIDPQQARRAACVAFCRRFRPAVLRPAPDLEMKTILAGLVDKPAAQS